MASIIRITDAADPRIAAYRDIRERDLVGRQGQFIAEGEVVLRMLVQSARQRPISVLVDERRAEGLAHWLGQIPDDVPVYAAAQSVLDAIAGFHLHRGILAHGDIGPPLDVGALLGAKAGRLIVALMGIANHDNMGGIFRNAAAFGADGILLDAACCDPFYRKAIRVSVGTALTMPFAKLSAGEDMVDVLQAHGYDVLALSPSGNDLLSGRPRALRTAILLGAEGPGLPADVLERTMSIRIPMAAGVDSLNVATTSGIVLFALSHRFRD